MKSLPIKSILAALLILLPGCDNNYSIAPYPAADAISGDKLLQAVNMSPDALIDVRTRRDLGDSPSNATRAIRINEVLYAGSSDLIEIKNYGSSAIDLHNWYLQSGKQQEKIANLPTISGRRFLESGGILLIAGLYLNDVEGSISLLKSLNGSEEYWLIDFLQYGSPNQPGSAAAVASEIWHSGDFIPTVMPGRSIEFDGEGNASGDWYDQAHPTPGSENRLLKVISSESAKRF